MANNNLGDPRSRNEAILMSMIDGTEYTAEPQSRIEALLLELKNAGGGGGGGKKNYEGVFYTLLQDENEQPIDSVHLELEGGEADITSNVNFGVAYDLTRDGAVLEMTANGETYYGRLTSTYQGEEGLGLTVEFYANVEVMEGEYAYQLVGACDIQIGATFEQNYAEVYFTREGLDEVDLSLKLAYHIDADGYFTEAVLSNAFTVIYAYADSEHGGAITDPIQPWLRENLSFMRANYGSLKQLFKLHKPVLIKIMTQEQLIIDTLIATSTYDIYNSSDDFRIGAMTFMAGGSQGYTPIFFGVTRGGGQ